MIAILAAPSQEMIPADHYQATVRCGNCFIHQIVVAPKGVAILRAVATQPCVKCGVQELHKLAEPGSATAKDWS